MEIDVLTRKKILCNFFEESERIFIPFNKNNKIIDSTILQNSSQPAPPL